jgi:hypothetical protein
MPDHYDVAAPEGYTTVTTAEANKRMRELYEPHAEVFGYDTADQRWEDNPYFALLRLRGICHTVYVVHDYARDAHLIVDLHTDGGPHTNAEISTPIESWGDALLEATRKVILGDTEIAETLTGRQRSALRDTDRHLSVGGTYLD